MNRLELAAEAARKRRGLFNPDDTTEEPAEKVVQVDVPPEFQADEDRLRPTMSHFPEASTQKIPASMADPIHVEAGTPNDGHPTQFSMEEPEILDSGRPRLSESDIETKPSVESHSIPATMAKLATGAGQPPIPPPIPEPVAPPSPVAEAALARRASREPTYDLYDAQEADRKSHLTAGMEMAARQLVGGITRTEVPQGIGAAPSRVPAVMEAQKNRRAAAVEALKEKRQARLDDSTVALHDSEIAKNNREKPPKVDPKAGNAESLRELLMSPVYADALAKKGVKPEVVAGMGEAGLKDLVTQMRTDTTNAATVEAGRASAAINREGDVDKAKRIKTWEAGQGIPDNIEATGLPTDKDKEDLKTALAGRAEVRRLANEMRAVLDKAHGAGGLERMGGDYRRELNRIQGEMTIAAKNAGGLGQITEGDMGLINSIRPDATSGWSVLRDRQSFETQLQGFEKWADNKVQSGMEARGFRMKGAGQPAAKPAGKPSPGPGYVRGVVNGKPGWVNKAAGDWEPD